MIGGDFLMLVPNIRHLQSSIAICRLSQPQTRLPHLFK